MRTGALPEGNIEELINRARSYIKAYRQPPYGMEVQGTTELLKAMADKLEEYKDLEEQGKLPKLPCAVGDTVYVIEADMKSFNCNHIKGKITKAKFDYWMIPNFGSLVFLTREEAEAALKEL